MKNIFRIIWFDLKPELKPPVWILMEWVGFLVQVGVYSTIISQLVTGIDNFRQFFAVGVVLQVLACLVAIAQGGVGLAQQEAGAQALLLRVWRQCRPRAR